jgi:hypothetical protein
LLPPSTTVFGPVAGLADWFIENWGAVLWETLTPFAKTDVDLGSEVRSSFPARETGEQWDEFLHLDQLFEEVERAYANRVGERADWEHRHLLGHGCSDLALPRIHIIPEDRSIVLIVHGLPKHFAASVDFLSPDKRPRDYTYLVVPKDVFQGEVEQFIRKTIERAKTNPKFSRWADWLSERWNDAQKQAKDPKRQLEWMIGEVSAKRVLELRDSRPEVAKALEKILLDCPRVTLKRDLSAIEAIIDSYLIAGSPEMPLPDRLTWRGFAKPVVSVLQPDYIQGYQLARLARKRLDLTDRPVRDPREVLRSFGVRLETERPSRLFRVAVCASRIAGAHVIPSATDARMQTIPGFRFGVFSGLGRLLWQARGTSQPICAAQGDHAMISQSRRANAFAAEFLLPSEVIQGLSADSREFLDRVEAYGVSRSAARWHLHNANTRAYG